MSSAKVSIVIPVYNSEKYIEKCLDSVVAQTFRNIEIILVDDGSKDSSDRICDAYASRDDRILVIHQQNQGVAAARLCGFRASRAEYILFIDSDDYVDAAMVERLLSAMERYDVDMVSCQYMEERKGRVTKMPIRPRLGMYDRRQINTLLETDFLYNVKTHMAGMNVYLVMKLIKRQYVEEMLKQGLGLWYGEDMACVLSLLYRIQSFYVIPDYLYIYRRYEEQVTHKYFPDLLGSYSMTMNRIQTIDQKNFLAQQLPCRCFNTLALLNRKMILNGMGYDSFKKQFLYNYDSAYGKTAIRSNLHSYGLKERLKYYLIKNKFVFLYYLYLKLKLFL